MLESISFNLPCQKAQFEEASYSSYCRVSLIALGSISFLISMLVFYRIPGMNSLGMSGGWSFFGCGFAALLGGVLVRCKEKVHLENENSQEIRLLGNHDITQSVEPCPLLSPFDLFDEPLLLHLFSFFNPKTLAGMASVSHRWNMCAKVESLWERHCLRVINQQKPPERSWRNQYKLFSNWLVGRAQIKTYPSFCRSYIGPFLSHEKPHLTLQADGSGVELFPRETPPGFFQIGNLVTRKTQKIDVSSLKEVRTATAHLIPENWIAIVNSGKIFCFDLNRWECFYSFPIPKELGMSCRIQGNNKDIIISNQSTIIVRNLIEQKEPLLINFESENISKYVSTTPNFVIVTTSNCFVHYVKKSDTTNSTFEELYTYDKAATSGSYVTILDKQGDLKIYKDVEIELKLLNTINRPFGDISPNIAIQMFQNWAIISNYGVLKIWNADTGIQITEMMHGIDRVNFVLNSERIIVRDDSKLPYDYTYTFYDFSTGVENDNSENKNSSWISNLLTSFMRNA